MKKSFKNLQLKKEVVSKLTLKRLKGGNEEETQSIPLCAPPPPETL